MAKLKAVRDADAIRAALGILDHAAKGLDLFDVLARLEAVERLLAQQKGKR
jgi:hypothetical protein